MVAADPGRSVQRASGERAPRAYAVGRVERAWRRAWYAAGCHRADLAARGRRYFVHDAAPFPSGDLHMGHVRTYVLGDMVARYQRARGASVLYHTGFDAFGLPIELAAIEQGVSPAKLVKKSIHRMTEQLRALGISYDWSMVSCTSDPSCYRFTQWLFLEMFAAGLVERRRVPLPWCPECETTLARMQVEDGACWRCATQVQARELPQWFILISHYEERLTRSLEQLDGWSSQVKSILRGILHNSVADGRGSRGLDWLVSRQRSWGTPIPLVQCPSCGVVPVPEQRLPVVLPDNLDWSGGSGALARCKEFVDTTCPACEGPAARETDTLDCFFDDIWCVLQALVLSAERPGFTRENLVGRLPVDRAQSGHDTVCYFHLYRFLGCFLVDRGLLEDPELIRRFDGNNVVLSAGRKMSKHLGNAVCPDDVVAEHGADVLRVAMLWAGGPQRPIEWNTALLGKATTFIDLTYDMMESCRGIAGGPSSSTQDVSRAARALRRSADRMLRQVTEFIDDYRPHAALAVLNKSRRAIEQFTSTRVESGRLRGPDRLLLASVLEEFALALAPFAPHLAEECWKLLGHRTLACLARWPSHQAESEE